MIRLFHIPLLLLLSSCALLDTIGTMSEDAIGEVDAIEGSPRVVRGARYIELGPGTDILVQDVVVTGGDDRVRFSMVDGTSLALGSDSEFAFHVYSFEAPSPMARMSLSHGSLRVDIGQFSKRGDHTFEVNTPSAEIDVDGNVWAAFMQESGTLETVLLKGRGLTVHNSFGSLQVVKVASGMDVAIGQAPGPVSAWDAERLRNALKSTYLEQ